MKNDALQNQKEAMKIFDKASGKFDRMFSWFAILFVFIFIAIFVGQYLLGFIMFDKIYSEGDRYGQIVKLSQKGYLWKTWEAEMLVTQNYAPAGHWEFSIDAQDPASDQFVNDIKKTQEDGGIVKVHYIQRYGTLPWRGETTYFIQSISTVER